MRGGEQRGAAVSQRDRQYIAGTEANIVADTPVPN